MVFLWVLAQHRKQMKRSKPQRKANTGLHIISCHFHTGQRFSFHRKNQYHQQQFLYLNLFFTPECFSFFKQTLKLVFLCNETSEYRSSFKSYASVHPFRIVLAAVISFSTADHSKFTWTESFTGSAKQSPLSWGSTTSSSTNLRLHLVDSRVSKNKLHYRYSWLWNPKVKWEMHFKQNTFVNSFAVFSNVI